MKLELPLFWIMTLILFANAYKAADDIALTKAKINELTLEYEKVALCQAQGLTFKCYFDNIASFDHTGIYVNLKIVDSYHDTIYNNDSPTITVAAQSSDSVTITVPFSAPEGGKYTFIYKMFQDIPDAIPGNNTSSYMVYVDDYLFQRDNGMAYGPNSWSATTDYYEIGNLYEVHGAGEISAASVYVHPNTEPGAYIFFNLYEFQSSTYAGNVIAVSQELELTADDIGDTVMVSFDPPVSVSGQYPLAMMVGAYGGYDFEVGMSQHAPDLTAFYNDFSYGFVYITSTPMVRMYFDYYLGTEESVNTNWGFYPNPASNKLYVNLADQDVHSMIISNVYGEVVLQKSISSNEQIGLEAMSPGVYFVSIDGATKKLVIE